MKITDLHPGDILYTIWLNNKPPIFTALEIEEFTQETNEFTYVVCIDRTDSKIHGLWIDKEVDLNTNLDYFNDNFYIGLNEQLIVDIFKELC